mmetsp:Transcript_30325/g.28970  ORF Transcript_30325/g.28970 Transcript_30325/m.28970 type:complete len:288 (+) Transcript_30325:265-1128(+)
MTLYSGSNSNEGEIAFYQQQDTKYSLHHRTQDFSPRDQYSDPRSERTDELNPNRRWENGQWKEGPVINGANLYIRNIDFDISNEALCNVFSQIGEITSHHIVKGANQKSRGFGFMSYRTPEQAQRAITELGGRYIGKKAIVVMLHVKKEDRRSGKTDDNTFRPEQYVNLSSKPYEPSYSNSTYEEQITDRGFERRAPPPIPERTCPYPYSTSDKEKMYYSGGGTHDYPGQLKPEYVGDQRFKTMASKNQISDQMAATHNAYLQQVRIHENKVAQESHNSNMQCNSHL